jgi:retron-type reverse transcriptase
MEEVYHNEKAYYNGSEIEKNLKYSEKGLDKGSLLLYKSYMTYINSILFAGGFELWQR